MTEKKSRLAFARELLDSGGYTFVAYKDGVQHVSQSRGVAPVLELLANGTQISGFSVADKIVGKAAALLFVLAEVGEVFAHSITNAAIEVLTENGIAVSYNNVIPFVLNRSKSSLCPMEQTVANINNPKKAYEAIRKRLEELQKGA